MALCHPRLCLPPCRARGQPVMCAAVPRPNGVVRADQRSDPRHKTTTKISTPPPTVAISRWPSLHPRLAANHPPISRGPWPRTGATSKETSRETVHPGNQRRAGAVSDAHAAMAAQWQAAKMSFRLGQPEPVFFTRDGRIARGTGDEGGGNGCHVSLTLDGDGDQAGKETT